MGTEELPDDLPDFAERELESRLVHDAKFIRLYEDRVRLPDGHDARRVYVRHPGAVAVIPFLDPDTVLLEHQYRYPLRRHFIELPAGKIDPGEAPLDTARRELVEECGYRAERWQYVGATHPCIGYSDERIELYIARGLDHIGHGRDHGEFIEVLTVPFAEALAWIRDGRITDAKTIVGLLWADRLNRGEWA